MHQNLLSGNPGAFKRKLEEGSFSHFMANTEALRVLCAGVHPTVPRKVREKRAKEARRREAVKDRENLQREAELRPRSKL